MMHSGRHPFRLFLLLMLLAVAFLLRLYRISWGLPDVFEEATPLREAWKMWGWGPNSAFDPNPHFFNYPSLTIYCQFLGQGALYLGMRLAGTVDSAVDYAAYYAADPTPFLVTGRLITTLFGVGTVLVLYRLCRRIASPFAACAAAFFLAISTFDIQKSQMVEVDVPLAFFSTLALLSMVRVTERPSLRNYLLAGIFTGLAVSTKYTVLVLLLPLSVSHLLVPKGMVDGSEGGERRGRWIHPAAALSAAAIVFFVTSPFVLLDHATFLRHIAFEREHMREGHFGLERAGTILFYIKAVSGRILGWPLLVLAAGGAVYRLVRSRRPAELILISFAVPYCLLVATWAMKADRYLMPVLPVALAFSAAAMDGLLGLPALAERRRRIAAAVLLFLAAGIPLAALYPAHLKGYEPDSRTLAREWIETNVPTGAFIVMESYGPELLTPHLYLSLESEIRSALIERTADRPQYAVQPLPMLQVYPERTAVFYDMRLYPDADIFITSSAITSRYYREPERFPEHLAFYGDIGKRCVEIGEFRGGTGPVVTLYRVRGRSVPFGRRRSVEGPRQLRPAVALSGIEALFYSNLGANYLALRFYEEANACYDLAFGYGMARPFWFSEIVIGKTRALMALGRAGEAVAFLRIALDRAPTPGLRKRVEGLIRSIDGRSSGGER